jgi:hypothetical protein
MAELSSTPPARRQVRRPGRRREVTHKVKVTEDQEGRLVAKAAERNITVSRLLVESALAGGADVAAARAELAGEMFRVVRLLGRVGLNVNQLAKVANATGSVPPEAPAALAALTRATDRLTQLLADSDAEVWP